MKEAAHSASVVKVTLYVATTLPVKLVEEETNVAQDDDDDDDDIIAKELRYAGIVSPASSMCCSSPAIPPMSPAPVCSSGNYEVHPMIRTHSPTNKQTSDLKSHVVPTRCIRVIKVCSTSTLKRRTTRTSFRALYKVYAVR